MSLLEGKIKDFAKEQGVAVVGIAGPERLDGPPSLDAAYTLPGAKSIVAMAIPMDIPAINAFLSKESPVPHNLDQIVGNQRIFRICHNLAQFIQSQGYRAVEVPPNQTYRKELDPINSLQNATFSLRFGAIAAGIGAQGWSGNVKIPGHGAAVYLGAVLTDAVLVSDPVLPPRHFIDNQCVKCKRCAKVCPAGMFEAGGEEYILLNNRLHPRGKRNNIHLCSTVCFGLHALSRDKKWSTWSIHWIKEWIGGPPHPNNALKVKQAFARAANTRGDSFPRYDLLRKTTSILYDENILEKKLPIYPDMPEDQLEQNKIVSKIAEENLGVMGLKNPFALSCGGCSLICGPDLKETDRRYRLLIGSGFVAPDKDGRMINVKTFDEAVALRKANLKKIPKTEIIQDAKKLTAAFAKYNFGLEPKSVLQGKLYDRKLKKAVKNRLPGHKEAL